MVELKGPTGVAVSGGDNCMSQPSCTPRLRQGKTNGNRVAPPVCPNPVGGLWVVQQV